MSRKEGIVITCDRCGKVVILENTATAKAPAGWKAPGGWIKISMQPIADLCQNTAVESSRDLCPMCSGLYVRTLNEYLDAVEE